MSGLLLDGVEIRHGDRVLVEATSLDVAHGRILSIRGGSSGDRTRILDTLAGVTPPSAGRILLDGEAVTPGISGIVTERHELLGGLTAFENVAVRALGAGSGSAPLESIEPLFVSLGLPRSTWHNLAEQLSGGQQQRIALARALLGPPPLLRLDEPTSELDPASSELVWDAIGAAAAQGTVVVVTSDDPVARCDQELRVTTPAAGDDSSSR